MAIRHFALPPYVVPLAKLFLVPIMLWVIGRNVLSEYHIDSLTINPLFIVPAIIVNQIALSLFASRMQIILKVFGITISRLQSLRIHLQSVFYFFALPMTVGLEAARFAKVKHIVGSDAQVFTLGSALLADRLIGAIVALILAAVLLPFMNLMILSQWDAYSSLALVIGGGGLILIMYLHKGVRSHLREAVRLTHSGRKGLWLALMVSISTHLVFAFGVYIATIGAHLEITFPQTLFAISAAMLFVIFPISFAGISPVEAATFGVLLSLGMSVDQALVFVFISYFAKLIAAFEGGGWELYEGGEYVSRRLFQARKEKL